MLRATLRVNAISCLLFGYIFTFNSNMVIDFLGSKSFQFIIPTVGGILLIFGTHLVIASLRNNLIKGEIFYFVIGDSLWVILSALALISSSLITSKDGVLASIFLAFMVGTFGLSQYVLGRSLSNDKIVTVIKTHKTPDHIWRSLSDFGNIQEYHPMVKSSRLLSSPKDKIGAERECTFTDNSQVKEKVCEWIEGKLIAVEVLEMNMPVQYLKNRIEILDEGICITAEFQAKDFFSEVLVGLILRPFLIARLKKIPKGFALGS